jgi:hypothetical protein
MDTRDVYSMSYTLRDMCLANRFGNRAGDEIRKRRLAALSTLTEQIGLPH